MTKITVVTLFPNMLISFLQESIVKRAVEKGLVEIAIVNLRDFAKDSYGSVDDRPYGGGAGMVLRVDCVADAIKSISSPGKILLTSAKGSIYSQKKARELSKFPSITIIAGHYEGVDERILDYVDEEISLGDFVLTGGEIAAAAIIDSIVRLLPGVLKKNNATEQESFYEISVDKLLQLIPQDEQLEKLKKGGISTVRLLEYPHYTRPEEFRPEGDHPLGDENKKVPSVLMKGNHAEIENWRMQESYRLTQKKRPDLLLLPTE